MPGLLRGMGRVAVAAGTATAVSNRVSRRQARKWGAQDGYADGGQQAPPEQQPQYAAAPAPPPPPAGDDPRIIKLQQLAELKGQGILSEEEFAAEKARVLGS